jgi:uncharacterized protein (UPF0332 family)
MSEQLFDELQRLTPSQGMLLRRLVDLGYLTRSQVDDLINRLVGDRMAKAEAYHAFAQQLNVHLPLHHSHIVSRCYYAMYHAARAVVLHFRQSDLDDHDRLPTIFGQVIGQDYGEMLGRWREERNQADYSPYAAPDSAQKAAAALDDTGALLIACFDFLHSRGVKR